MNLQQILAWVRGRKNDESQDWPPKPVQDHWQTIHGYRLRYRNNRLDMIKANPNVSFDKHKMTVFVPVPWPRELARFSAGLLFSQPPTVIREGGEDDVNRLLEVNDFGGFCIRGGTKVAAEGQGAIRIIRDSTIAPDGTPLITWVDEDQVIWDTRHGHFIVGGTVVVTREDPGKDPNRTIIWRLLEEHTPGRVTRKLFRGDQDNLGEPHPLTAYQEFASLNPEELTGIDRPTLVQWQNVPGGESDFFGLGPLFDELNEAESLLLDRSRKSIPRVFVDRSLADETGRIDIDGYIMTGGSRLRPALGKDPGQLVNVVQPNFLSKEHIDWVNHLSQLIVTTAGYAPETWGIQGQTANVTRAVSGYAIKLAQLRTLLTRAGKEHMALQALGWAVACCLAMMASVSDVASMLPVIELGDGLPDDPLDGAQEVLWLRQAMAASTLELVQTLHPNWDDAHINAEVERIMEEKMMAVGGDMPMPGDGPGPASTGGPPPREPADSQAPAGSGRERNAPIA